MKGGEASFTQPLRDAGGAEMTVGCGVGGDQDNAWPLHVKMDLVNEVGVDVGWPDGCDVG